MKHEKEYEFYEQIKDWNFDVFDIKTENLTNWDMYEILEQITDENSKVLDLGTGGGEKVLKSFPTYLKEIKATDFSKEMIKTAEENLKKSGRTNIEFSIMDNLNMTMPKDYFNVVVARNTVIDPKQIYEVLKENGYLLVRGVDKYDCHCLKKIFGKGQAYFDEVPIGIRDYEAIIEAGFKDIELIPLHQREYFKNKELLRSFLLKVPIIDDFCEEDDGIKDFYKKELDDEKLNQYISENTSSKGIKLIRRYYGITARK